MIGLDAASGAVIVVGTIAVLVALTFIANTIERAVKRAVTRRHEARYRREDLAEMFARRAREQGRNE